MANEDVRYFETQIAFAKFHSTVIVEEGVVVAVLYCQPLGACPNFFIGCSMPAGCLAGVVPKVGKGQRQCFGSVISTLRR